MKITIDIDPDSEEMNAILKALFGTGKKVREQLAINPIEVNHHHLSGRSPLFDIPLCVTAALDQRIRGASGDACITKTSLRKLLLEDTDDAIFLIKNWGTEKDRYPDEMVARLADGYRGFCIHHDSLTSIAATMAKYRDQLGALIKAHFKPEDYEEEGIDPEEVSTGRAVF